MVANYAASEEAVGAFFSDGNDKGKAQADDDEGLKKVCQGKHEAVDNDFIVVVERKKPRRP